MTNRSYYLGIMQERRLVRTAQTPPSVVYKDPDFCLDACAFQVSSLLIQQAFQSLDHRESGLADSSVLSSWKFMHELIATEIAENLPPQS